VSFQRLTCGEDWVMLSGDDPTALGYIAHGGHGCISVTANVAPRLCADLHRAWAEGRVSEAIAIQDGLLSLHDAMFCESSPGPVKYAASLLGLTQAHCRLPLAPISESARARVRAAMVDSRLLS
jgi:4-hydroxy-tetrahydrodipicolinate synthase